MLLLYPACTFPRAGFAVIPYGEKHARIIPPAMRNESEVRTVFFIFSVARGH